MEKKLNSIIALLIFVIVLGFVALAQSGKFPLPFGSVTVGNEYESVTASSTPPAFNVLRGSRGALGSVIITTAGIAGGRINLYDATTTDATKRTTAATTTLASFASNTAVGTYVFDIVFNQGLLVENTAVAVIGTTTITWR